MWKPAPDDACYVTTDLTVRIPGGLLGVSIGTEVTMVADKGAKVIVSNGRDEFELNRSQVTNDPKLVAVLLKRAQAMQAEQEQFQAQQNALRIKQQEANVEFLKAHPLTTPQGTTAP